MGGAVGRVKDAELGREARMAYDLVERPVEAELYESGALKYRLTQEYDRFEQPSVLQERVEEPDNTRSEHTVSAAYDKQSRPTAITCESRRMTATGVPDEVSKRKLTYHYDGLGRIAKRGFHANGEANVETEAPLFQSEYTYVSGGYGANSTTARVQSIEQSGQKREYWYDKQENITRECWQGKAAAGGDISFEADPITSEDGDPLTLDAAALEARYDTTYAYDALGQLLRANDQRVGTTWTYAYDQGGNILEKKRYAYTVEADLSGLTPAQTVPYAYGDANWKDKLTAYDSKAITHDAIGNPLSYDGWAYTWKAGRMLHNMVRSGENAVNAQFTYDHTGLRVKKSVNGVDTLYTLNGKRITHVRKDNVQMHFFYDAQGRPMMVRYNGTDYAYLHNLQGDIVSIVDMSGTTVVEYGYDAWGKPVTTEGSMAGTLGKDNPFRYRGYVWDEETGLYYLRSRYYDPSWGRFINSDTLLGTAGVALSHNLFAYCNNNPVNRNDPTGLSSGSPFEWAESPWYWSDVTDPSQADMVLANNGYRKDGVTVSTNAIPGVGRLYVPALDATFIVNWGAIGKYHLDISPDDEGMKRIATHFGFTMEAPGTTDDWKAQGAWKPVEAYLEFKGSIVAGSINLLPHRGSGEGATLNLTGGYGNICFYTHDSKQTSPKISRLVKKHQQVAMAAYTYAVSMRWTDWVVKDR